MTQQDKELLLEDLCARLLYGVNGLAYIVGEPCNTNTNIVGIINKSIVTNYESPMPSLIDLDSKYITIKPYLRPMSNMTEEEWKELNCIGHIVPLYDGCFGVDMRAYCKNGQPYYRRFSDFSTIEDWLNANHFDYRGLIEKGLALEAPDGMYNIKEYNKI